MFPYPSGRIHMGHVRNYAIGDVLARFKTMRGYNVLHPMGWDAFGLPAENAAIEQGVHPAQWTTENIRYMRNQLERLGISYDWSREINTCEPDYYKWNQWFFLKFYEKGLAYRKRSAVNWCPSCNTVLANEQVEEGRCWRCGSVVVVREIPQWALRITAYADQLLEGLNRIDWPERVVAMQHNWIGRSDGLEIDFAIKGARGKSFRVFTTRADTIFGATYVAAAPDHPLVAELAPAAKKGELQAFAEKVRRASKELGEGAQAAEKEGLDTGIRAKNPFTGKEIPVWVANFVLAGYGTGAVMSVPAHDQRDYEFAVKYGLPIAWVIRPSDDDEVTQIAAKKLVEEKKAFTDYGYLFDSGEFSGMPSEQALAKVSSWVNTTCPKCGGPARREAETMDTFVDSSWYWARYLDPKNGKLPFSRAQADRWLPVDVYVGGPEHAVLHLLYFRFWTMVMQELGLCAISEPAQKLVTQGIVKGRDGAKMSKSIGNVVSPREIINEYGADTARLFILFAAPAEKDMDWSDEQVQGQHRFLGRVWRQVQTALPKIAGTKGAEGGDELRRRTHKTILRVTQQ